jgi:hypothetical protein
MDSFNGNKERSVFGRRKLSTTDDECFRIKFILCPVPTASSTTYGYGGTIGTNDTPQQNLGVIIVPSLVAGAIVTCLVVYIYRSCRVRVPKVPE